MSFRFRFEVQRGKRWGLVLKASSLSLPFTCNAKRKPKTYQEADPVAAHEVMPQVREPGRDGQAVAGELYVFFIVREVEVERG